MGYISIPMKILPPVEVLRDTFFYDLETGHLHRKRGSSIKRAGENCRNGYRKVEVLGKDCLEHRVIWKMFYGIDPASSIDHRDGNKSNNRIENLRIATVSENNRNVGISSTNRSGVKGVSWDAGKKRWRASIQMQGTTKNLGNFRTIEEAACARRKAAAVVYGEFSRE